MDHRGMRAAVDATIAAIEAARAAGEGHSWNLAAGTDLAHFHDMRARMDQGDLDEGKIGRWLGWIQGAAVAHRWLTLDQCKAINRHNGGLEP